MAHACGKCLKLFLQVNQLLERNLKAYIKVLTCYPERLEKKDYDSVMREFKHSEKASDVCVSV